MPVSYEVTPEKTPCFVLSVFSLGEQGSEGAAQLSRFGAWNFAKQTTAKVKSK